jgi:hypothetical protein
MNERLAGKRTTPRGDTMEIQDLAGTAIVDDDDELEHRLRTVRKGDYGAAVLSHGGQASLWIHINKSVAYLHFFPDRNHHPGFQPTGMTPSECDDEVHFLPIDGGEADSITLPCSTLVPVAAAYQAAKEFMHDPILPPSISWLEL